MTRCGLPRPHPRHLASPASGPRISTSSVTFDDLKEGVMKCSLPPGIMPPLSPFPASLAVT